MRFSHFFIDRPIFAVVVSVFIALAGLFALPLLPLSQYPEVAPPSISVMANYPGATAEALGETVAAPLEQQINGVENMLYMTSSSTASGQVSVTVVFKLGTDLNDAQVQVQNRVTQVLPRLPQLVRDTGVTVRKNTAGFLMVAALRSTDPAVDIDYVGNYAMSQLRDRLLRTPGVSEVNVFGGGNYAMRVWVDPGRAAARGLDASDVVAALRAQNVEAAAGALGQSPVPGAAGVFEQTVQVRSRLRDPAEFANVVIKADARGVTRLRDVARVELGAQDYFAKAFENGKPTVSIFIVQQPGSNALAAAKGVEAALEEASRTFPAGIAYSIPYNPTNYVAESVHEVQKTLFEAIILVVIVVVVFLQSWRAAIIPVLAIPISLLGAIGVLLVLGFSLNSLSLFGLVLAIGIVVDDAIVVVENVERNLALGMTPREATVRTMDEVSGALVAIGLVLSAVFIPTAFMPGIPGRFFIQFAVTIASATLISVLVSLTLSPALAALLLKPHKPAGHPSPRWMRPLQAFGRGFNAGFERLGERYGRFTARAVRMTGVVLVIYVALLALTGWRFAATPAGFIPQQDQGAVIGIVQLPPGSSLDRTDAVVLDATRRVSDVPGVDSVFALSGFDIGSFSVQSQAASMFMRLDSFEDRKRQGLTADGILAEVSKRLGAVDEANIIAIQPPSVPGIGVGGGFKMQVQDRGGAGYKRLEQVTQELAMAANRTPGLAGVFTLFNTASPRVFADVDRDKAQLLGLQPSQVYQAMGAYLGSSYVNDFNLFGRTFRVTAQADAPYRATLADIANIKVRTADGSMAPIGSVATLSYDSGPVRVVRHNIYPSIELQGHAAPGYSSGEALAAMEALAAEHLPEGFSYEWTELALQEKAAGATGAIVFLLAVVFVFLLLAAQYESIILPLAIILIVPMCLLSAMLGVNLRGMDNNILTQIGLVVLVGLAAKNAILIVEFAKQAQDDHGMTRFDAAINAARTRLRPILMTSLAFILGVVPLALASGPGAEMRQALGTAVFFGMLGVTAFGLGLTPVFYVICRGLGERLPRPKPKEREVPTSFGGTPHAPVTDTEEGQ